MLLPNSFVDSTGPGGPLHADKETIKSLTYVSRSQLPSSRRETELEAIITVARARNASLGVTGALIASTYTFAQILEGPPDAVDALMASIFRDRRHREVKTICVENDAALKFPSWAMAFAGNAHYIDRHIEMLLDPQRYETDQTHVADLQGLIAEFSKRIIKGL